MKPQRGILFRRLRRRLQFGLAEFFSADIRQKLKIRRRRPNSAALGSSPGAEPLVVSQGAKPPEAKTLFADERSMEAANSPIFLKFGNAENHRYLSCFSKKIEFS